MLTWTVAGAYVVAGVAALWGLATRDDPRVLRRLGVTGSGSGRMPLLSVARRVPTRWWCAGAGAAVALAAGPSGPVAVASGVVLALAGYRAPGFLAARRATARRAAAEARVPDLLDLVAVGVSAGLTTRLAMDRAAGSVDGPLAADLEAARREVSLGRPWHEAVSEAAGRSGLKDLRRLSVVLERSARLGTPAVARLRSLARDVRSERRARVEERARRAPVVMLFPLVLLILPAFVLAAVLPAVLVAVRGLP